MKTIAVKEIERLIVVVDIRAWLLHPDPGNLALLLQHCVRKIVSSSSPSCRWAFKLFDSSLSPFLSRCKILKLLGNWACSSRFDSVLPGGDSTTLPEVLSQFCSALKCLQSELLKTSTEAGTAVANANASFVALSLQELVADYVWDPLLAGNFDQEHRMASLDDHVRDSVQPNSNLVLFFSCFPRNEALADFLGLSLQAASETDLQAAFSSIFRKVRESFGAKNIHLCWIDVPCAISSVDRIGAVSCGCEGLHRSALSLLLERLGWTSTSFNAILAGFKLIPFPLLWQGLAYPPLSRLSHTSDTFKLCIEVRDVSDKLMTKTLCKVEAISLSKNPQMLAHGNGLRVCSIVPSKYFRRSKLALEQLMLCQFRGKRSKASGTLKENGRWQENDLENELDRNSLADYILERLQQETSTFETGKPTWQLLLLHLARQESLAIVDFCKDNSSYVALLEPFTVHLGILSIFDGSLVSEFPSDVRFLKGEDLGHLQTISSPRLSASGQGRKDFDDRRAVSGDIATRTTSIAVESHIVQNSDCEVPIEPPQKRKPLAPLNSAAYQGRISSNPGNCKKRAKPNCQVKLDEENRWQSALSTVLCNRHLQHSLHDVNATLEELYIRNKRRSNIMKAMSCWMRQTTQTLRSMCYRTSGSVLDGGGVLFPKTVPFVSNCPLSSRCAIEKVPGAVLPLPLTASCPCEPCPIRDKKAMGLALDNAKAYTASLDQKIINCLSSPEIDLFSFAERVVADARSAASIVMKRNRPLIEGPDDCKEFALEVDIVEHLIEILLQKPKKLASKYKKCRPPSTSQMSESELDASDHMYSSEGKVRECELQIHFRMAILALCSEAHVQKQVVDTLVNEICTLLESIQFNLPGGVFEGESLLEFSSKVIKARYNDTLPNIVNDIYVVMEFNGHDDYSDTAKELDLPDTAVDSIVHEICAVSNTHDSLRSGEESFSQSDNPYSSSSHGIPHATAYSRDLSLQRVLFREPTDTTDLKLREAKEKRERAKRFSHFASTSKDVLRVTVVPKVGIGRKKCQKNQSGITQGKPRKVAGKEIILQTPFPSMERLAEKSSMALTKKRLLV